MADEWLDILDDCLARLEAGASVEDCLALHPEQRAELEPLLLAAARLRGAPAPAPRAEFVARSPDRLIERLLQQTRATVPPPFLVPDGARPQPATPRRWRPVYRLWPALAAAVVVLAFVNLGLVAAARSLPGDPLYPLKRASETVSLALARSPEARAGRALAQAEARLAEAVRVAGREELVQAALADYAQALAVAAQALEQGDALAALSQRYGVSPALLEAWRKKGITWHDLALALTALRAAGRDAQTALSSVVAGASLADIVASLSLPATVAARLTPLLTAPGVTATPVPPISLTVEPTLTSGPGVRGVPDPSAGPTAGPGPGSPTPPPGATILPGEPTVAGPGLVGVPTLAPTLPAVPLPTAPTVVLPGGTPEPPGSPVAPGLPTLGPPIIVPTFVAPTVQPVIPTLLPVLPTPTALPPLPTLPPPPLTPTPLPTLLPTPLPGLPSLTPLPTLAPPLPTPTPLPPLPTLPPPLPTWTPLPPLPTIEPTLLPPLPTIEPTLLPPVPTPEPTLLPPVPTPEPTLWLPLPTIEPTLPLPTLPPAPPTSLPIPTIGLP